MRRPARCRLGKRLSVSLASSIVAIAAVSPVAAQAARPLPAASATLREGFSGVRRIRELADGRVLVLDSGEQRLVVTDFGTQSVREVGRSGSGPGEFRQLSAVYPLSGDSSLVEDQILRRWIIMVADRSVVTVIVAPGGRPTWLAGADRLGRVLDLYGSKFHRTPGVPYTPMRTSAESLLVLLRHRAKAPYRNGALTGGVDTVARIAGSGTGQTVVRRDVPVRGALWLLDNPLASEDQALLFPDGWIALAFRDPYRVEWISPSGARVRGPTLPFSSVPVDDSITHYMIRQRWPRARPGFQPSELPPLPATLPAFLSDALLALPDGRLCIRRTFDPHTPSATYDLIDRSGRLTGGVQLAPNERLVGFGTHAAYVVSTDDDDVEWLSRHPWQ